MYDKIKKTFSVFIIKSGAPDAIWTHDLFLRREMHYPAVLRGHLYKNIGIPYYYNLFFCKKKYHFKKHTRPSKDLFGLFLIKILKNNHFKISDSCGKNAITHNRVFLYTEENCIFLTFFVDFIKLIE